MKNVIIIGAGIAGLTAGIYARMSGFETTIYESHTITGGASTSWKRKGYLFEGGMHWLTGSSPKTSLHKIWREVGALNDSVNVINRDPFFTLEHQGQTAYLYRDVKKLQQHFLEIAPEDRREILRLCRDIRKFFSFQMPVTDIKGVEVKNKSSMSFTDILSMLPALPRMGFYAKMTAKTYAERYKSPILKIMLQSIVGPDINATGLLFTLATLMSGDGGYPEGGSLAMDGRMAQYFESLGGRIEYKQFVDKVSVKDNMADGIIIGKKHIAADAVIVTQDTLTAIDTLFDAPISEPWANKMREETVPMLNTFISLGIKADLSDQPESLYFTLVSPIICAGIPQSVVGFNNYATFKNYAPDGCTAMTTAIMGDSYDFWKQCKENGTYAQEKQKLAEAYINALSNRIPGIADKIAVWDVATPLTYERYLHSYKGSWMTIMSGAQPLIYPQKPETIENVYFAGQRLRSPGGLPMAADSGRKAVQYLCLDTDTVFQGNC
ncbi:MAG: NAD(P)/FAD-dependent oxidoreductase [Eubacteriales bacterium]